MWKNLRSNSTRIIEIQHLEIMTKLLFNDNKNTILDQNNGKKNHKLEKTKPYLSFYLYKELLIYLFLYNRMAFFMFLSAGELQMTASSYVHGKIKSSRSHNGFKTLRL